MPELYAQLWVSAAIHDGGTPVKPPRRQRLQSRVVQNSLEPVRISFTPSVTPCVCMRVHAFILLSAELSVRPSVRSPVHHSTTCRPAFHAVTPVWLREIDMRVALPGPGLAPGVCILSSSGSHTRLSCTIHELAFQAGITMFTCHFNCHFTLKPPS